MYVRIIVSNLTNKRRKIKKHMKKNPPGVNIS